MEIEKIEKEILFEEKIRVTEKKKYRILLPIGPKVNWRDTLALTIALAKAKEAEICLLRIKRIPHPLPLKVTEKELEKDKKILEEAQQVSKNSGVNTDAIFMASRTITGAITEIIQKEKPNLLITSWKGYSKITKTGFRIFGRKLDRILRTANCDLIVARIHHLNDLKHILIPCIGGPHASFAGDIAKTITETFGGQINVIFVASKKEAVRFEPQEKLKNIVSSLNIPAHIPLKSEVLYAESSSPQATAYQIVQRGQDFGCILMASTRDRIFREILFGNVPEIVARNSPKSLILVKHHKAVLEPVVSFIYSKLG